MHVARVSWKFGFLFGVANGQQSAAFDLQLSALTTPRPRQPIARMSNSGELRNSLAPRRLWVVGVRGAGMVLRTLEPNIWNSFDFMVFLAPLDPAQANAAGCSPLVYVPEKVPAGG
jgi:hypothetical protein